jgi:hypothetical protein
MGAFGPTSDSKTTTIAPDESVNLSDQAVSVQDRSRNRGNITLKGRGAQLVQGSTYITNEGPGAVEIAEQVKAALNTAGSAPGDSIVSGPALQDLIDERLKDNEQAAKDAIESTNPLANKKFILIGITVVAVIAIIVVVKRKN